MKTEFCSQYLDLIGCGLVTVTASRSNVSDTTLAHDATNLIGPNRCYVYYTSGEKYPELKRLYYQPSQNFQNIWCNNSFTLGTGGGFQIGGWLFM